MTQTTRPGTNDRVGITKSRGFDTVVGAIGRIRVGDKPDQCTYCNIPCSEWPNVDLYDGTTAHRVPVCAMEAVITDAPELNIVLRPEGRSRNVAGNVMGALTQTGKLTSPPLWEHPQLSLANRMRVYDKKRRQALAGKAAPAVEDKENDH